MKISITRLTRSSVLQRLFPILLPSWSSKRQFYLPPRITLLGEMTRELPSLLNCFIFVKWMSWMMENHLNPPFSLSPHSLSLVMKKDAWLSVNMNRYFPNRGYFLYTETFNWSTIDKIISMAPLIILKLYKTYFKSFYKIFSKILRLLKKFCKTLKSEILQALKNFITIRKRWLNFKN